MSPPLGRPPSTKTGLAPPARHPGFDEDLIVVTDSRTLTQVHRGRLAVGEAIRAGAWETQGPPELARELMVWGGRSPFAGVTPVTG